MDEYLHEIRIPKARIAVLIGAKGETKKELESISHTSIDVDSQEGIVRISGDDAINLFQVKEMIQAIARGFNPDIARQLLKHDIIMEMVSLADFSDKKKQLERVRGRIIGAKGKSRELIEQLTETNVSVYGKTVAIIGYAENVAMARNAITMLIEGATHAAVYKRLEKFRRKLKEEQFMNM